MLRIVELCDGSFLIEMEITRENLQSKFSGYFIEIEKIDSMPKPKENGFCIEIEI